MHGLSTLFIALILPSLVLAADTAKAEAEKSCSAPAATKLLREGIALQKELESDSARESYEKCLSLEPQCLECLYEIGWSYWQLGQWPSVIETWEKALKLKPDHPEITQFLPAAKENLALVKSKRISTELRTRTEIGTVSQPSDGPLSLTFVARRQSYNPKPDHKMDVYDAEVHSPKSVHFSKDGKKVYVNALEAGRTLVYKPLGLEKLASIHHKFPATPPVPMDKRANFGYRFPKTVTDPNQFLGKPVELALSHEGRYLWAPYYRRTFDENGTQPSAVAIIDTETDQIVRVMNTGPISKYVKASPNGHWMAISHWGDNTVGLIDIRAKDPKAFKTGPLLVVDQKLPLVGIKGDRDKECGLCVRGLAYSSDSKTLFVSRMSDGGVTLFDLGGKHPRLMGTVFGILPGPRDLELKADTETLLMSCNASGFVAQVEVEKLRGLFAKPGSPRVARVKREQLGVRTAFVGLGARSIRLSPNGRTLFVAVNKTSELVAVDVASMEVQTRIPVDSYPVGIDVSPDGSQVWVTSQGRDAKGGNSIGVFQVRYRAEEAIRKSPVPNP